MKNYLTNGKATIERIYCNLAIKKSEKIINNNRKCCLNCAFCTRNQNTWHSSFYKPELSKWSYDQKSLNASQRIDLKKGNDNFLGQEIRVQKAWDEQLEQKQQQEKEEHEKHGVYSGVYGLQRFFETFENSYEDDAKRYDLSPRPIAPSEDYLSCFHGQWNESQNPIILKNRKSFLENKKCSFYYPFKKMHEESLDACEKNRKDLQESKRFQWTISLVGLGIAVTLLTSQFTIPFSLKPLLPHFKMINATDINDKNKSMLPNK